MEIISLGGGFVSDHLPYRIISVRLQDKKDIEKIIDANKPDVIINCIGKTGRPNIDWCENNKEETAFANVALPVMLADCCGKHGIHLINIGSGCIYFGESPNETWVQGDGKPMPPQNMNWVITYPCRRIDDGWKEGDMANPKSFYSKTKYACDLAISGMNHVTTLRLRQPISEKDHPRNLINKLRNYKQIIDIPNSITFMKDFVRCVDWFATSHAPTGIYHVTNPGPLTAVQIMKEYQKYITNHTFDIISEQELDQLTTAKRSNCILNSQKLANAGFHMTPSADALVECMKAYQMNTYWSSSVK